MIQMLNSHRFRNSMKNMQYHELKINERIAEKFPNTKRHDTLIYTKKQILIKSDERKKIMMIEFFFIDVEATYN